MRSEPHKGSAKKIVLLVTALVVMIVVILAVILWRNGASSDPDAKPTSSRKLSEEEIAQNLQAQVEAGMFSCEINPAPIFASGDSQGLLAIRNGPSNGQDMRVRISLDETGEIVYTSTILRPGEQKGEDTLSIALAPGEYPATALVEVLKPSSEEVVANLQMALTLTIQE